MTINDKEISDAAMRFAQGSTNPAAPFHEGLIAKLAFEAGARWALKQMVANQIIEREKE